MSIAEYTANSLSEYIKILMDFRADHKKLWYRGHASANYTLQPTVYRAPYSWKDEKALLHQFKARGARFIQAQAANDMEWLFIMQHHATPTRLLDWSENALVALAFATQYRENKHNGHDANVWCLNPEKLNEHIRFSDYESEPVPNICDNSEIQRMFESARQDYPIAIIGPQTTDRIVAQRGVFTFFPSKDSFDMESLEKAEEFLVKIVIPDKVVSSISSELYYLGVSESTLFPELDSISKELRRNYEMR